MLVNDNEALERINSKDNLLNRLKSVTTNNAAAKKGLDIFTNRNSNDNFKPKRDDKDYSAANAGELPATNAPLVPSIDHLIDKPENQIKLAAAHNAALDVMNQAMSHLSEKMDDIRAANLPSVITAASKVVESIRKERAANQANRGNNSVNFHFYTPEQRRMSDYQVIEVGSGASH